MNLKGEAMNEMNLEGTFLGMNPKGIEGRKISLFIFKTYSHTNSLVLPSRWLRNA